MLHSFTLPATLFISFLATNAWGGNTDCLSTALDWYTDAVGETPCMTYQRLRQICNSDYEVPTFAKTTPGDTCDDQLSDCCCNSIAFALSMLCMNCQQDTTDPSDSNGIDAGSGAYYLYRFKGNQYCGPGTNQSLPTSVQTGVCNEEIRLDDFLYNLFWDTGAWFYTYTREAAQKDQISDANNTFTHCADTVLSSTLVNPGSTALQATSSTLPSTVPLSASTYASTSGLASTSSPASAAASAAASSSERAVGLRHRLNTGAVAGGVLGAVALIVIGALVAVHSRKRRKSASGPSLCTDGTEELASPSRSGRLGAVTPYISDDSPPPPCAPSKWTRMQCNAGVSSSTVDFRSGLLETEPTLRSGCLQMAYSSHDPQTADARSAIGSEQDARKITGSGLRPPAAYQSEWSDG